MIEHKWLTSDDPQAMLDDCVHRSHPDIPTYRTPSDRKLRLFAVACCRQVWNKLTDERSRRAVEVAERYADGLATEKELARARSGASSARNYGNETPRYYPLWLAHVCTCADIASIIAVVGRQDELPLLISPATQADLLRDIVGNPFRLVPLRWEDGELCGYAGEAQHGFHRPTPYYEPVRWLTPLVRQLAQAAYDEHGHKCGDRDCQDGRWGPHHCERCNGTGTIEDGTLDSDRLLILADALEDAGCNNEEMLQHLRGKEQCEGWCGFECMNGFLLAGDGSGPCQTCCGTGWRPLRGPHVRGCHVLDCLLGKE